jgi:hemerythrin
MLLPLEWTQDMCVGVPALDEQHQHILSLLNELIAAYTSEDAFDEVADKLALFSRRVHEHFLDEEKVQANIAYPDLERHRGEHRAYNTRVTWLHRRTIASDEALPHELLEFLRDWWEEHILVEDTKYRDFLESTS